MVKNPPANTGDAGDVGSIPGLGKSSGEGNGSPLQYSCLENPMNQRSLAATITKTQTLLSNWTHKRNIVLYCYIFIFFQIVIWKLFELFFFFFFFFLICGGFCHTLKWNSQGFTCVPHPNPPSHLPLHPFPLVFPSAPGPSTCLMHPTWAGDLFHPR